MSPKRADASKKNCWEVMQCGRQPGGKYEHDFGTCPATKTSSCSGVNNGKNAGRACWTVAGTMSPGRPAATYVEMYLDCTQCRFYKRVKKEEGENFDALEAGKKYKAA
jgi:hypothetical protein